jgi:chorismate synthase
MSNTFGRNFRVTTWGESHGPSIGAVIDGCPAGIALSETDVQPDLDRRRPGQNKLTSARQETDRVQILSGVYEGKTLGTPISLVIPNVDARPQDYTKGVYRPSHADFTYHKKYGVPLPPGGGRASARETASRVAAGAVAKKFLLSRGCPIQIVAYVLSAGTIWMPELDHTPTIAEIESSPTRCPHPETAQEMCELIEVAKAAGDSVGGIIMCEIHGVPVGLGDPVFDRLEADLAKAMLSIPATKGFEIGSGFAGTVLRGSEHNDAFVIDGNETRTAKNHSGGVQGGISNGEPIVFRVAFKPPATIALPQSSINHAGDAIQIESHGRHDPCVLPRAIPIVEAMAALVIADAWLNQQRQKF